MPDDAFTDLETLQLSPFSRIQALDFFGLLAVSSVLKKKKKYRYLWEPLFDVMTVVFVNIPCSVNIETMFLF